jgi:hypothetical protein
MKRSDSRIRPSVEQIESGELLSTIIAANIAGMNRRLHWSPQAVLGAPHYNTPPQQFGSEIENLVFLPDPNGVPTPREQRRETFTALFTDGSYGIGPGRFSNEASHTYMRALGTSNQMLHCNMQFAFVQSKDLTKPAAGELSILDKNAASGNQLGFFVVADPNFVDRRGRPTRFIIYEKDVNQAAAFYDQGYTVGTVDLRYSPQERNRQGIVESGRFKMLVRAQVYNLGNTGLLTNSYSNP